MKKSSFMILPGLILITLQAVFQNHQFHSMLHFESLILSCGLIIIGISIGILLRLDNRLVSSIIIGVLFTIFLNFLVSLEYSGIRMRYSVPVYFLIGFSGYWFMRDKIIVISLSGLLAILLSTLFFPSEQPWREGTFEVSNTTRTSNLGPPIVHIILDGHLGLEAFPPQIRGVEKLKDRVTDIYQRHGFKVYPRAFSRHNYTQNSIPEILNMTEIKIDKSYIKTDPKFGFILKKSAVFEWYRKHGYDLNVFQTDIMDFCSLGYISYCLSAPYRNLFWLSQSNYDLRQKLFVLTSAFLNHSTLWRWIEGAVLIKWGVAKHSVTLPKFFPPVNMVEMVKRISKSVDLIKPGAVLFAHILLPHEPPALDDLCNLRPPNEWFPNKAGKVSTSQIDDIEHDQEYYFAQMNCTYTLLEELFDSIKENPQAKNAIVVVHGDHGSRIAVNAQSERLFTYSTLFAVRHPNTSHGIYRDEDSITTLFSKHVLEYLGLNEGKHFRNNSIMGFRRGGGQLVEEGPLKF